MSDAMIRGSGLTHRYGATDPILQDLDLEVRPGEIVALTGPSGKGKSTLLFILGLLLSPSSGDVLVQGIRATDLNDAKRARLRAEKFGFLFQDASLDPARTVLDNVTEPGLYHPNRSRRSLDRRAAALLVEFGVEQRSGARPGEISGGQSQRIALCRALVHEPAILVADEPTSSLDLVSAAIVLAHLRSYADSGKSLVLATHDDRALAHSDRVLRL